MSTLVRFEPRRRFVDYPELNRNVFAEVFRGPAMWSRRAAEAEEPSYRLPVDAYVTDHEIIVQAAFPGVAPESISVTIDQDTLTLTATLPSRLENVNYVFAERPHDRISRRLALNVPVDVTKAEAAFDNGLLTLTLPKAEYARPKTIAVTAK
jgi:HSP20 family protein